MNRKTLTLIIALVCAVVFVLGCTALRAKIRVLPLRQNRLSFRRKLRITVIWMFGKV